MKITKIETIRLEEFPRLLWVQVHTDEGFIGLGETYDKPEPVEALIHRTFAPMLLGQDPGSINALWQRMFDASNYHGYSGAEMRAISALDIALWDILGQCSGLPLHRLLGGAFRPAVPIYNTCVGYRGYRDHARTYSNPGELAEELFAEGIKAMKIWPFDELSKPSMGQNLSLETMKSGIQIVEAIRKQMGSRMEIIIEGHSLWNLTSAIRLSKALEPYDILFTEDLMQPDSVQAIQTLAHSTSIPVAVSERLLSRSQYLPHFQAGGARIAILDIAWCGGITEAKKIADMAAAFSIPFAPHNCGGPVTHSVSAHFSAAVPNLFYMESARSFYQTFFSEVAEWDAPAADGFITPSDLPGIGVKLLSSVTERQDAQVVVSSSSSSSYVFNTSGDPWLNIGVEQS